MDGNLQEDIDIDLSVSWPLGVVAIDDHEADDSCTLCDELLMQHCSEKELDREIETVMKNCRGSTLTKRSRNLEHGSSRKELTKT